MLIKSLLVFLLNLCTVASYGSGESFRRLSGEICVKHDIIVTLSNKVISATTVCFHKREKDQNCLSTVTKTKVFA